MIRHLRAAAVVTAMLASTPSGAEQFAFKANDTGGIIAWNPGIARTYRQIAADHCAGFDKIAKITSAHRRYGDYVGFRCFFPRGYDPRKGVWATSRPIRALY
jgi:hypothetical protein